MISSIQKQTVNPISRKPIAFLEPFQRHCIWLFQQLYEKGSTIYDAHFTDKKNEVQIRMINCPGLPETKEMFLGSSELTRQVPGQVGHLCSGRELC